MQFSSKARSEKNDGINKESELKFQNLEGFSHWQIVLEGTRAIMTARLTLTFKETPLILLIQGKQLSGSFADLGQSELHSPHFTFVPQSIFTWEGETRGHIVTTLE